MTWRWANIPIPPQNLLALLLGGALEFLLKWRLLPAFGWRFGIGPPLLALGLGLIVWSVAAVGDRQVQDPDEHITDGPYSLSRNPMYR